LTVVHLKYKRIDAFSLFFFYSMQVSYTEFYQLVTDPDPGRPDFGKPGAAAPGNDMKRNAQDSEQRAKEAAARDEKRKMLAAFVEENAVGVAEIQYVVEQVNEGTPLVFLFLFSNLISVIVELQYNDFELRAHLCALNRPSNCHRKRAPPTAASTLALSAS